MKRTLSICLLILIGFQLMSQDLDALRKQLEGDWVFDEIFAKEGEEAPEKEQMAFMNKMMKEIKMNYTAEGRYLLDGMGKVEEGNWSIEAPGTQIKYLNDKGQENLIDFRFDEEGRLYTGMNKMEMRLIRPSEALGVTPEESPAMPETVEASLETVANSWGIVDRIKAGKTKGMSAFERELFSDVRFNFDKEGKFKITMLGFIDEGTWMLEEGKIITEGDKGSKEWYIRELTEKTMILQLGKAGDTVHLEKR